MPLILLVEDNDLNREMLSRRLTRRDFELVTAATGEQVLDTLQHCTPDLILLDMNLPDRDGWELAQQLKATPASRSIPIIALTAHALVGDREKALAAGCNEYESKPIDLTTLLTKINTVLERGSEPPVVAKSERATSAIPGRDQGSRILVVSEAGHQREIVSRRLRECGYAVNTVATSAEAIAVTESQPFDLVFLDLGPAKHHGLDVLQSVRTRLSLSQLPVIVTASDRHSGVALLSAGANDFLTKPLDVPVLLARIQTQLAVRRALQNASTRPVLGAAIEPEALPGNNRLVFPTRQRGASRSETSGHSPRSSVHPTGRRDWVSSLSDTRNEMEATTRDIERHMPALPAAVPERPATANARRVVEIPGYEILQEMGRGGMGVVYKARHTFMNRLVALKVIDQKHLTNPEAVRRFHQEVQAAAQLTHRNIVLAYDAGQSGDTHYFAMEYVEGKNLAQTVEDEGPLPIARVCDYVVQASRGLQHAHEKALVHRDIKPSNLLLTREAGRHTIKILDMGLALLYETQEHSPAAAGLTRDGRVVGTADYMAPEQWMNAHKVDIRADLYSLGCTFYFLLTGRVPFPTEESMEKMLKHHLEEPIAPERLRPDVPPNVAAVLRRLMKKRPEERYQKPSDVAEALHGLTPNR